MKKMIIAVLLLQAVPSFAAGDALLLAQADAAGIVQQSRQDQACALLDRFIRAWLVEEDIDKAMTMVSIDLNAQFDGREHKVDRAGTDEWARKWLVMWMYGDHQEVLNMGHGEPGVPGYEKLATKPSAVPGIFHRTKMPEYALRVGRITSGPNAGEAGYIALLPLADRETVFVGTVKVNGVWKIAWFDSGAW